jgi:hypothetical protein
MDQSFRDMQRMQQQMDADLARAMRELQQQQPGVRIERSEQRGYGSYRWGGGQQRAAKDRGAVDQSASAAPRSCSHCPGCNLRPAKPTPLCHAISRPHTPSLTRTRNHDPSLHAPPSPPPPLKPHSPPRRYYESIEIRSGPMTALVPAHAAAAPAPLVSPLLVAALALGAAWAGVTALFARNFGLTTFSDSSKPRLLLTWPYLAAFSKKFRGQLASALRGERVKADGAAGGGGGGGGGGTASLDT